MKNILPFLSFLLMIGSCNNRGPEDNVVADFSSLEANSFVMKVERIAESPEVQFPLDELQEGDYIKFNDTKSYFISFSEDGQIVTIEPGSIKGEKTILNAESLTYELSEGAFAGGRFVVREIKQKFEGELTTYGSGIPIILSERGALLR